MALKVIDTDGVERTIPEVSEVGERVDTKVGEEALRAQGVENEIKESLSSAIADISEAQTTADQAKESATTANTAVRIAQETAESARSVAYSAEEKAENAQSRLSPIEAAFPSTASAENQLADRNFVNSSVEQSAANRVTYNELGDPFPTRAALAGALAYYFNGQRYSPNQHDYALVVSDEGAPAPFTNGQTRFEWSGTSWVYAYGINDRPFTSEERAALESGITAEKVQDIENLKNKPVVTSFNGQSGDITFTKTDLGLADIAISGEWGDILNNPIPDNFAGNEGKILVVNSSATAYEFSVIPVTSVNGKTGQVSLSKSDVGLSNVNNVAIPTPTTNDSGKFVKVGSNGSYALEAQEEYVLPIASASTLGGVKPVAKTAEMTQQVGVDAKGALFTKETEVPVTSVNNKTGAVSLSASDVGAIPNTTTITNTVNGKSGTVTITKGDVGLGNVNNVAVPAPTASDNGKVLGVVNGELSYISGGGVTTESNSAGGTTYTIETIGGGEEVGS